MSKKTKNDVLVNPNCEKAKINDYHRLTEKDYDGYKLSSLWCGGTGADAVQKLGQLEDLLEKYGITYWHELEHLIELANKYEELKIKVENILKAFEVIKPCCIVADYKCENPEDRYELAFCKKICITEEEYDLLKEVLL